MKLLYLSAFIFVFIAFPYWFFSASNASTVSSKHRSPLTVVPLKKEPFSESRLWDLVNDWKLKEDGYKFEESDDLCLHALERAVEIQSDLSHDGFFNHTKELYSLGYNSLGENISHGFENEYVILNGWLNSPLHRKNLDIDYTHSCIKCDNNYCVQLFAK